MRHASTLAEQSGRVNSQRGMALVTCPLERKRVESTGANKKHEVRIAQGKHDGAHINATFKVIGKPQTHADQIAMSRPCASANSC